MIRVRHPAPDNAGERLNGGLIARAAPLNLYIIHVIMYIEWGNRNNVITL